MLVSGQDNTDKNHSKEDTFEFTLYPNPTIDNVVYIRTSKSGPKQVTVYDVFGKIVLLDKIRNNVLNIVSLSPGVYLVQVLQNNQKETRKLIVK